MQSAGGHDASSDFQKQTALQYPDGINMEFRNASNQMNLQRDNVMEWAMVNYHDLLAAGLGFLAGGVVVLELAPECGG